MKSFFLYKKSYKFPLNLSRFSKHFNLYKKKINCSGRNNSGHICVYNRGGGHKQNYRILDTKNHYNKSRLVSIEYDPNRSSFIGLYCNLSNLNLYFDSVCESQKVGGLYYKGFGPEDAFIGNKMYIKDIPLGMLISSLEYRLGKGSQYLRSAGVFGKLQQKNFKYNLARIKMPSKQEIYVPLNCLAKIGIMSNSFYKNRNLSKAGRNR
jgi:large subunit ribosomal protein L2